MEKEKGGISVSTENIFPVIKRWLYSDKDIFLREVVSNACDAITKYRRLVSLGNIESDGSEPLVSVTVDKDARTITISDNGIGIPKADIPKIFEKSFTGKNGRLMAKSTGMGLYIAKKMCRKLGHGIYAESEEGRYTKITIEFADNDFYRIKD